MHSDRVATVSECGNAVELAPRVWWVGSLLRGDPFQCHVYLIEQGDQSVLIDPGSALIVDDVTRNVDAIVGVDHVRWLVCSHADPDILGAIPTLVARGLAPDAAIVTHWRDEALIRHCGWSLPFWRVEDHHWRLALEDRELQFIFTPYAHFPGAFATFDERSGTMFTSDLFGAFTDDPALFATSMDCFEGIKAFHEHYMPSVEALSHAIDQMAELEIRQIAPQHGQVIPQSLVAPVTERLRGLDCGLYLLAHEDPGLDFLFMASRTIHDVSATILGEASFPTAAAHLHNLAADLLGATSVEFWARAGDVTLCFDASDAYAGRPARPPDDVMASFTTCARADSGLRLVVPLGSDKVSASSVAVIALTKPVVLDGRDRSLLTEIADLVGVAVEREVGRRLAELDRAVLYGQATHDPLTGLYNRLYFADAAAQMCARDERRSSPTMAALMIDIDHFKEINDTYGHQTGDQVIRRVAEVISAVVRSGDVAVRYGGDEFLVIFDDVEPSDARKLAERIRSSIASDGGEPGVTVSVGVAVRHVGEDQMGLAHRADEALYAAKHTGRDRVASFTDLAQRW
jgi:diguanylate cyclase (GGDEF)-like protein